MQKILYDYANAKQKNRETIKNPIIIRNILIAKKEEEFHFAMKLDRETLTSKKVLFQLPQTI